jgi:integrase
MEVALYLKRPEAKTETSIFARISYEGNRLKYYLPEKIHPTFWNKKTHRAKETQKFREYPEFNARLDKIEADIKTAYRKFINDSDVIPLPETFKAILDKEVRKREQSTKSAVTFFSFFGEFIKRCEAGTRMNLKTKTPTVRNSFKGYTTTLNHIKQFQEGYNRKIDFDTIDLDFYNDYIKFVTQKLKLSHNTIGDHIKRIKTLMHEATEMGYNKNMAFKSRYFSKLNEDTDSIYLDEKEIHDIEKLDLSHNPRLDVIRDFFLIGCYTGLRFSDYSVLRADQIRNGFIETTQLKTGGKVTIPVHSKVEGIIKKYNGTLPVSRSNQKTNDYLKEIGEKVPSLQKTFTKTYTKGGVKVTKTTPKCECITTHTARRSFATNQYLKGVPAITIMAITGHKTEKAFLRYIKLSSNEHAKIMQAHWDKDEQLKAV